MPACGSRCGRPRSVDGDGQRAGHARRDPRRRRARGDAGARDGHELQRLRQGAGGAGARRGRDRGRRPGRRAGQALGHAPRRTPRRSPCALQSRDARPRARHRAARDADRRADREARRRRSRAGRAAVPVRPLPDDRRQPSRQPADEPAGHLERRDPSAVELELHDQHQHRDELLAGGDRQPRRAARAAAGVRRRARGQRPRRPRA